MGVTNNHTAPLFLEEAYAPPYTFDVKQFQQHNYIIYQ